MADPVGIKLGLVAENRLFAEGLRHLFDGTRITVMLCAASVRAAADEAKRQDVAFDLVFANLPGDPARSARELKALDALAAEGCRSLVLDETLDLERICTAFAAGVDGVLISQISRNGLIAAIELVMTGEKVFPSEMATLLAGWSKHRRESCRCGDASLSGREHDVVELVAQGLPNKAIARDLCLSESTVKVHLQAVQRKLDLDNRTQIAIWAHRAGMGEMHPMRPSQNH